MKKLGVVVIIVVLAGAAGFLAMYSLSPEPTAAQAPVSEDSARVMRAKIEAVKRAGPPAERSPQSVVITEEEMESYVLFELRKDIPAQIESLDVQLGEGTVGADVKLTFPPDATGNAAIDAILNGTHTMFVKGALTAENRMGRFTLQETRLDGIPIPPILIEGLITRFVKPRYPDVDLSQSFELPWGVRAVHLSTGSATIDY